MAKAKSERVAFWVFIFFIVLFAAATVTIVIIAVEQTNSSLPEKIDVVIYRPPSGEASRLERYKHQARAVRENMNWVNQVFVLSASPVEGSDFEHVPFEGTHEEAFEFMPSVPNVQQYAVFLGDRTIPVSGIKKGYLFHLDRPRIANIFRNQSEVNLFEQYLELPTMPLFVADMNKLAEEPRTWTDLVFREVTEERIVLRSDMNRDVFVISTMLANANKQFDNLETLPPLFATFHVPTANNDLKVANDRLLEYLENAFPIN